MTQVFQILLFAAVLCGGFAVPAIAQDAHRELLRGDRAYRQDNFPEAGERYRDAARVQPGLQSWYNLGNSLYRQGNYAEAAEYFRKAADAAPDAASRSRAWYNLGNAQFQQGDMSAAVEAYKNALRHNPQDADTRHNLALALRARGEGSQQQAESAFPRQQRGQAGESPPSPRPGVASADGNPPTPQGASADESKSKQEPGGDPQQGRQEGAGRGSATGETGTAQSGKQAGNGKPQPMNKSEAEQLLQIMEREEQKVQQRLRRAASSPPKSAKDW